MAMKTKTHSAHLALQILRAARDTEADAGLGDMPPVARDILHVIADSVVNKRKIPRVSDVVAIGRFGTPPTVYSHLAALENAGWIEGQPHPGDGRAKLLTITPQARRLYRAMGRVMAGEVVSARQTEARP